MRRSLYTKSVALLLGFFLVTGPILAERPPQRAPRGTFIPNFRDMEIKDFLENMARVTKKNILVDDSVKGKINIIYYKPIPISRAMDFLRSVLEVRGYAIVEEGNIIKVIPAEKAQTVSEATDGEIDSNATDTISKVFKVPPRVNLQEYAQLLKSLAGKGAQVETYRSGNAVIVTGYAPVIKRLMDITKSIMPDGLDKDGSQGNEGVHIYQVKNLQAESLAQVLVRLDNPAAGQEKGEDGKPAAVTTGKIKAVAHKESNSVIVTANSQEWEEIKNIIDQLDQPRQQILLEVLIVEVRGSNTNDFGIDWRYQGVNSAHTQFNSGYAVEGNLVDPETGRITGNNTLSGFSLGFLERGGELLGIFNANIDNQNFNVLSAPQMLTLDNQEAEINVGQDVPVRTQERTSGGGSSEATVNSFEYRPAGIKLKFTPHINTEGNISLDVFAEVTNIEGGASSISNPTFSKRNVKTYITVDNQQTIVIGGLVSNERLQAIKKIPLLGDIPLLGFLFRRTTMTNQRTNLMIFITPHILDDRADADRITNFKRETQINESRKRVEDLNLWPQPDPPGGREEILDDNVEEHPVKPYKRPNFEELSKPKPSRNEDSSDAESDGDINSGPDSNSYGPGPAPAGDEDSQETEEAP
ncbi:MAG: type II secretion system protein GspD [Leptospiraceae bacterium]|nr:type II secretion system protein GspD [Leptospiraceae bacterium]